MNGFLDKNIPSLQMIYIFIKLTVFIILEYCLFSFFFSFFIFFLNHDDDAKLSTFFLQKTFDKPVIFCKYSQEPLFILSVSRIKEKTNVDLHSFKLKKQFIFTNFFFSRKLIFLGIVHTTVVKKKIILHGRPF